MINPKEYMDKNPFYRDFLIYSWLRKHQAHDLPELQYHLNIMHCLRRAVQYQKTCKFLK